MLFNLTRNRMNEDAPAAQPLHLADYVVFALMLLVSTGIGLYSARIGRSQSNPREFLTGGRKLTALPVSLSLTAGILSSIISLSLPVEVTWQDWHPIQTVSTWQCSSKKVSVFKATQTKSSARLWELLKPHKPANGSLFVIDLLLSSTLANWALLPSVGVLLRSHHRLYLHWLFCGAGVHIWSLPPSLLQAGSHQHLSGSCFHVHNFSFSKWWYWLIGPVVILTTLSCSLI